MQILHNHIGYELRGSKRAILQDRQAVQPAEFGLRKADDGSIVYRAQVEVVGGVGGWKDRHFCTLDFSDFSEPGDYYLQVGTSETPGLHSGEFSRPFAIEEQLLFRRTVTDVLDYFKAQRCSGEFDKVDSQVPFFGDHERRVDAHGGWHDASGDRSKYLSHLSYANHMNPQQIPMLPWIFLAAVERLHDRQDPLSRNLRTRLRDEAAHGGDFLVRMQDPSGYFYSTIFDNWTADPAKREICAYTTQKGFKSAAWQAGLRQGGGIAIAALAKLAAAKVEGEYPAQRYFEAAVRGFDHLAEHNGEYLNDGKENIIDDYCGLMAAVELFRAAQEPRHLEAARARADALLGRQVAGGALGDWWRADDEGRPYFHAAEAGLPTISLCNYLAVEQDASRREQVLRAIEASMRFELAVTARVVNPFGYARQYVKAVNGEPHDAFFMPHDNESGYWWQGENARLASLAAAARMVGRVLQNDTDLSQGLQRYAQDQLNWILGLSPFDACMLHGHGHNNRAYDEGAPPSCGGICNGITSGIEDESDIEFDPRPHRGKPDEIWRWTEQWLLHPAWYLMAVCQ